MMISSSFALNSFMIIILSIQFQRSPPFRDHSWLLWGPFWGPFREQFLGLCQRLFCAETVGNQSVLGSRGLLKELVPGALLGPALGPKPGRKCSFWVAEMPLPPGPEVNRCRARSAPGCLGGRQGRRAAHFGRPFRVVANT